MGERRRTVGSRKLEACRAAGRIVPGHPTRETRTMLKVGSDFYILLQAPSVSATRSLRTWLALKESTRRESMVTGTPVLGSRPRRECLRLTVKVPKRDSLTLSPAR
jgi:hypothetical protein